jgi:hypothetical protein
VSPVISYFLKDGRGQEKYEITGDTGIFPTGAYGIIAKL